MHINHNKKEDKMKEATQALQGTIIEEILRHEPTNLPDSPVVLNEKVVSTLTRFEQQVYSYGMAAAHEMGVTIQKANEGKIESREAIDHLAKTKMITSVIGNLFWMLVRLRLQIHDENIGVRAGWVVVLTPPRRKERNDRPNVAGPLMGIVLN